METSSKKSRGRPRKYETSEEAHEAKKYQMRSWCRKRTNDYCKESTIKHCNKNLSKYAIDWYNFINLLWVNFISTSTLYANQCLNGILGECCIQLSTREILANYFEALDFEGKAEIIKVGQADNVLKRYKSSSLDWFDCFLPNGRLELYSKLRIIWCNSEHREEDEIWLSKRFNIDYKPDLKNDRPGHVYIMCKLTESQMLDEPPKPIYENPLEQWKNELNDDEWEAAISVTPDWSNIVQQGTKGRKILWAGMPINCKNEVMKVRKKEQKRKREEKIESCKIAKLEPPLDC